MATREDARRVGRPIPRDGEPADAADGRDRERAAAEVVDSNGLGAYRYLLDTHADGLPGGTGVAFDWAALQSVGPRCLVAGGLLIQRTKHIHA